ncbi:MAG: hypothetical protein A3D96_06415 [Chlamydiae bacterium RIFCSPHIGHO2_12_FULL_44_59]|nr:MAG: hypothetical protein A2796_06540 [Chlamydiae bacterium RIFCSPHIGHO2_01_FULL_44_39]OGN59653.1 MAG: hypothetical protein A3D96_06415 [Chlamydiae bacterium RIFCSPHIGHO2_12_FULL_44_59]OGN65743.1 MAG: hypothetical protein A2978_07410 [Chlamydiae bacterium RIFCSPLOWO2_01_FULL_44_52]OGN67886.1 MAG: hypothetical protein A3I67_05890 [Chlamydiae bacterium RIFCSPLOWO2_02_FULL_45_22]OGN69376.1 MAG: hypothetical protein A3F79_06625 [Chlamydiae bacterium RIFCSPLOWO2_12_FULL_45_20]
MLLIIIIFDNLIVLGYSYSIGRIQWRKDPSEKLLDRSIGWKLKIVDLTVSLSDRAAVSHEKRVFVKKVREGESGIWMEDIHMTSGIGTHMDAPSHFYQEGRGIDEIPLSQCMAPACVIHLEEKVGDNSDFVVMEEDLIEWEERYGIIPESSMVLIHTGWDRFAEDNRSCSKDKKGCHFPGISSKAAALLVDRQVRGVGIDTLEIDPGNKKELKAHQILLQEELIVVEGLTNLSKLPPKGSFVFLIPIKIAEGAEAPIRAFALVEEVY